MSDVTKKKSGYEPTEAEATALQRLKERQSSKPTRVGVVVDGNVLRLDHPDEATAARVLMEGLGATDREAFSRLLQGLAGFGGNSPEQCKVVVNGLIGKVTSIAPKDQVEMMLAGHMAVTDELIMTMARRLNQAETVTHQDSALNALTKLSRTYTAQMEALRKHRHGGQQKVTVEHVTVNEGGQAIVGNIEDGGRKKV